MNQLRFVLVLFLATASSVFAQQKKRVVVDDILRAVSVSDPQISPDGRLIACVVSRPNAAEDRFDSEIGSVDVASGKYRTLTHDRKGLGSPRWSPSGDRLAFLANAPTGEKKESMPQIFIMPMQGGDSVKITDSATGVQLRLAAGWKRIRVRGVGRKAAAEGSREIRGRIRSRQCRLPRAGSADVIARVDHQRRWKRREACDIGRMEFAHV
jgi:dipeptidyl aminopeptidase/acylaminoacyl peptidase